MRQVAAVLFRLGLVLLLMAGLVRLFGMPDEADAIGDDLALVASGTLVAVTSIYLGLTRGR